MPETPYLRGQLDLLTELSLTLEQIPGDGGQRQLRNALRTWINMVGEQLGEFTPGQPRFTPDEKVSYTVLATDETVLRTYRVRGRIISADKSHSVAGYIVRAEHGDDYRWVPEIDLEPSPR